MKLYLIGDKLPGDEFSSYRICLERESADAVYEDEAKKSRKLFLLEADAKVIREQNV